LKAKSFEFFPNLENSVKPVHLTEIVKQKTPKVVSLQNIQFKQLKNDSI